MNDEGGDGRGASAEPLRALVTGGAGFIGSRLAARLVRDGHVVTVVDDLSTGSLERLAPLADEPRLRVVEIDITAPGLEALLASERPDVVFHLAAQSSVPASVHDPVRDAEVNVAGTVRVLRAAGLSGVRKVLYAASGGTLYRSDGALPMNESAPRGSASPYGISKAAALAYLAYAEATYGLRWSALALANVYGPGQDPSGEAGVVAIFADLAKRGGPLVINGDGEQTRDFVHVDDVVDAFVRALGRADGRVVNIGTGIETSVNALAAVFVERANRTLAIEHREAKPGEVRRSALDPSLARELLGWEPRRTLASGVAELLGAGATVGVPA